MSSAAGEGVSGAEKIKSTASELRTQIKSRIAQVSSWSEDKQQDLPLLKQRLKELNAMEQSALRYAENQQRLIDNEKQIKSELEGQVQIYKTQLNAGVEDHKNNLKEVRGEVENTTDALKEMVSTTQKQEEREANVNMITSRIKDLFSVASVLSTLRHIVRGAIQDFQELDKQFNEIAIVSNYSTKEMWQSFSDVNKVAQEFGVTTKNVLEVQNLYYHQGKDMAEVNKLTAQTLTLAKITGMDYERATSDLTAALNAYNIAAEDAVRVTDTIAAMDTNAAISSEELMTALTKTASIAANAGMSLESTEVFLTKMIETTREAPENLGTALKTIIARFGEVKQEIDGEEIELADINRVDTALKSVGISLLDTAGQIRDLDDVFMELSSKWDGLDRNTQRYIATIAAGSRQQSRFIAMMEDYDRTLELTEIAQNSAGLGAKQLAKSMESIETSVNRLKSTWQEFYSGFITSGMIKGVLDLANAFLGLLNGLNKISPVLTTVVLAFSAYIIKTQVVEKLVKNLGQSFAQGMIKATADATATDKNAQSKGLLAKILSTLNHTLQGTTNDTNDNTKASLENAAATNAEAAAVERLNDAKNNQGNNINDLPGEVVEGVGEDVGKKVAGEVAEEVVEDVGEKTFGKLFKKGFSEVKEIGEKQFLKEQGTKLTQKVTEIIPKEGIKNILPKAGKGISDALSKIFPSLTKFAPLLGKIAGLLSGPVGLAIAAVSAALVIGIKLWKKYGKASVDDTKAVEKLQKAQENYNNTLNEYNNLTKNAEIVEKHRHKTFKSDEDKQEEQEAIRALVEEYPSLLESIDEEGNYHIKNTEAINEEIKAKRELAQASASTYSKLRAQYAQQGIYADENTLAGQSMSNIKTYYEVLGEDAIKDLAKEIDKFGELNKGYFKEFAAAYASGEKTSFDQRDFSNLFTGSLTKEEFKKLTEEYAKQIDNGAGIETAIREALVESGSYTKTQIDDIASVWTELNAQTGDMYSNLLTGIGEEINEIYVQEAQLYVEEALSGLEVEEEVKSALEKAFSRTKVDYTSKYEGKNNPQSLYYEREFRKARLEGLSEEDAILATVKGANYESLEDYWNKTQANGNPMPKDYKPSWVAGGYYGLTDSERDQLATQETKEIIEEITNELKNPENLSKVNQAFKNFGGAKYGTSWEDLDTGIEKDTSLYNFLKNEYEYQQQEIQAIIDKVNKAKKDYIGYEQYTWIAESLDLSNDQWRLVEEKYEQLGDQGGSRFLQGLKNTLDSGTFDAETQNKIKNLYLNTNPADINSITKTIHQLKNLGVDTTNVLQQMVDAAGGLDAFSFGDVISEAEKLNKELEQLTSSLEGFVNLGSGKGNLNDVGRLLNSYVENSKDAADLTQKLKAFTSTISYTSEGIQAGSATTEGIREQVSLQQELIYGQMQLIKGDIIRLSAIKNRTAEEETELKMAIANLELYKIAWGEIEAAAERAINDKQTEQLEKQAEKFERIRDAVKDTVSWLREYEKYADLDAVIEDLQNDFEDLEFEINFSTNTDVIKKDLEKQLTNINTQIAANQGGMSAAEADMNMYRQILQSQNSRYVSFDESGNLFTNQEELYNLQLQIEKIKSSDRPESAEVLENEYEQIKANIEGYREAKNKVNEYSDALQDNFTQLDEFLDGIYESVVTLEDKLIQVRQEQEDKELELVKDKYEAIKDENDKYLDSIRDMIDEERRLRDRADREQDVKDKEKKLAMMKMDTSGVYANDIRALEKELEGDYRSLEDDAVDNAINELEKTFDAQAESLDKEVAYLEKALAHKREMMTEYNQWAQDLIKQGSDEVIRYLEQNDQEYVTGTQTKQQQLRLEWEDTVNKATTGSDLIEEGLVEKVQKNLDKCKENANGFKGAVEEYSKTAVIENGEVSNSISTLTNYYQGLVDQVGNLQVKINKLSGAYSDAAAAAERLAIAQSRTVGGQVFNEEIKGIDDNPSYYNPDEGVSRFSQGVALVKGAEPTSGTNYATQLPWYVANSEPIPGADGRQYLKISSQKDGQGYWAYVKIGTGEGEYSGKQKKNEKVPWMTSLFYAYAKGGYVDYTGPAWVDGTKSHPEYMLNATQTQQFETLVAALSSMFSAGSSYLPNSHTTQKTGDAVYNFHINVDQMSSDYDVDQLIDRIEKRLVKAGQYRNVTMVRKTNN
jgi:TP901 family phage tail tape measure protein